jgi:hypothetical protein
LFQILSFKFEIFRANLFLADRGCSETNCSSLLSVALISFGIVVDVYSVKSSAYIETLALLKDSGMSFVKIEKKGLNIYTGEFLTLIGLYLRGFH